MWYLAVEGEEHNPILPIWQEIVVGALAFAILAYVLMKFVFPRMEKTFQARVDAIEGGIQRAEATQAEANQLLARYQQQLNEVRTEAAKIRDDARADADALKESMRAQAREESDRIIAAGREALGAERATIVRELQSRLGALSVDLASRIVGESLADEARRAGTVERFLAELEASETDTAGAADTAVGTS